jgi:dihydrofolate reductase
MKISMIVAMDRNRVIGDGAGMPWHHPADLKRFRALTLGKPVVMGRKTHEAIGRVLPGRLNIVISRDPGYQACPGAVLIGSTREIDTCCGHEPEVMIIGGGQLYKAMLPVAEQLILTIIEHDYTGSVTFPCYEQDWQCSHREVIHDDSAFEYPYRYETWHRKA